MTYLHYTLLLFSALLGGSIVFLIREAVTRYLQIILSFSGAYLFGITVLHLIPEVYHSNGYKVGLFILLGFFIQLMLEQFSKGTEHGHIHAPKRNPKAYMLGIMFGLSIHAFIEGIPLASNFSFEQTQTSLLYGIILHKIPAAFALTSVLFLASLPKSSVAALLTVFAVMSPLGLMLGQQLYINDYVNFDIIIAIVIGSFLHISTTILFESGSEMHRFNILKIIAILAGVGISLLTM